MKLIFRFKKTGRMAYTAHLDLQRTLLRILRMSGLKPAYSTGFNPHPKMSLALPLSLGFESLCEYLEVETENAVNLTDDGNAILSYLNKVSPDGLLFTGLSEKRELAGESPAAARSRKSLASRVLSASYDIFVPAPSLTQNANDIVSDFMQRESIPVEKKNFKKGTTTSIDIRPQILSLEVAESSVSDNNTLRLSCTLSATAGAVLSPLTLIEALNKHLANHEARTESEPLIQIVRTNINFSQRAI